MRDEGKTIAIGKVTKLIEAIEPEKEESEGEEEQQ
eukprot:CAMPEP_0201285746 /NCGR_PEP_ID=MMETSP1317-20130820/113757_1 /ASSEMBLY_ACC=CAM_ASM_000770 /TAXON_ID=187299 /ORGANISM="Undescribed Undescribed, Strain Undescribed" /LENGTH=34 /DNA_ID= /DNA_START= /DNA_END= /DNA_ORIENTATION=